MKTITLITIALLSIGVFAASKVLRVETTEIYGDFQSGNSISTYKFTDGLVTCYGSVSKIQGNVSTQALSCVK